MLQVSGYMTSDGSFFEKEEEALRYEAERNLALVLDSAGVKNMPAMVELIIGCRTQIIAFLATYTETDDGEKSNAKQYEIDTSTFDGAESEEDERAERTSDISEGDEQDPEESETVQSLPPGVRQPMPNLGRHIQPAKIRQQRPVNGPRSGGSNAPGIRRR